MGILGDAMNRWGGRRLQAIQINSPLDSSYALGHRLPDIRVLGPSMLPLLFQRFLIMQLDPYRPARCILILVGIRVVTLILIRSYLGTGETFHRFAIRL